MKVLFIGNSFTARNDVPGLVAALAQYHALTVDHQLISAGGASLRMHWNKGAAQAAMQGARFDYVVLQEQSTLPIKNAIRMHENIRLFDDAIKASGAKTVLYQTWARQNAPASQTALSNAYAEIGRELKALVVPAGDAWQRFMKAHKRPVLHDKDLSHPTPAGSYLAACVFCAALLKKNPVGAPATLKDVTAAELKNLQQVAWETVKG